MKLESTEIWQEYEPQKNELSCCVKWGVGDRSSVSLLRTHKAAPKRRAAVEHDSVWIGSFELADVLLAPRRAAEACISRGDGFQIATCVEIATGAS